MKTAFVFPGQGSQKIGMGKDLYDTFKAARTVFEEVDDALKQNLSGLIFEGNEAELTRTENAQPAIMAVGMAIVRVLETETGKKINALCDCVAGHSLGEYTALCAAGALSLSETAQVLKERGWAMGRAADRNPGGMAAVLGLPIERVRTILAQTDIGNEICVVANDNCPGQAVLSGQTAALDKVIEACQKAHAKKVVKLAVSGGFHSPLMDSAAKKMKEVLADIELKKPLVPVVSNVSARFEQDPVEIKNLLVRQVTGSVLWTDSVRFMNEQGVNTFVECGNGSVLTGLIKKILSEPHFINLNSAQTVQSFF